MNGAALRSDWPPAGEATPTPRGAGRGERGLAGGAPFTNAVEQRSGRAGPVGAGPRGGRAGPGPHGAAPPRAPRGPRALRAGSGQAPTRAELLSRVFSRPGAAALGPASHSKFGGRLLSRTAAAIAALPLLLRISAAGSRPGPPPVPRRCPRRAGAPQEDEGVPGPAGAVHFPAGEWRLRRGGSGLAPLLPGLRSEHLLPQQPPGQAGPGAGAVPGAGKSRGEPGAPPVQDSEGERGWGRGRAGGDRAGSGSCPLSPLRRARSIPRAPLSILPLHPSPQSSSRTCGSSRRRG